MRSADDNLTSEFNMAVSYLNRLNSLFYACDESAISLDIYTWYHVLMALYRELSTDMDKETMDIIWGKIKEVNQDVDRYMRKRNTNGMARVDPKLHHSLHEIEIMLRKVLDDAGLQNKKTTDAMRALK